MVQQILHVAVVDDDASVRRALARLLRSSNMRAETFESGGDFLAWLVNHVPPDCAVIDLQMPEMTGLEILDVLARLGRKLPVIVITAHEWSGVRRECLDAGAVAYLRKPIDGTLLLAAITTAVGEARSAR